MPIFHRYKCIFIHIPKTGGGTIRDILGGILDIIPLFKRLYYIFYCIEYDHMTYTQMLEYDNISNDIKDYFSFAIVRNPWDRLLSEYMYKKKYYDMRLINANKLSFRDFVYKVQDILSKNNPHLMISHFIPQYKFIYDENDNLQVDYVGKFENLKEEITKLSNKYNIGFYINLQKKETNHKHYSEYYDDDTRAIIADIYSKDIELFGYTFDNQN
jgi:hypothetical protein